MDTSTQAEWDRRACEIARRYLVNLDGVTPEMLHRQTSWSPKKERPPSLAGIYQHLLATAQNAQMNPNVIGRAIGGTERLGGILCEFEPVAVAKKYGSDWQRVLGDIVRELKPKGQVRTGSKSLWPRFCKTITSGAQFLTQFKDARDFYGWADLLDQDDRARPALPMLLKYEIVGFGFPLACDFIKDLGYLNFGKPDVHLKKIFTALGLSPTDDDYQVFKSIVRVAKNVETTPYEIDQLFWLIGSGNFYLDGIEIGGHRTEFIDYARKRLTP